MLTQTYPSVSRTTINKVCETISTCTYFKPN